jgi:RecG-like helicase
MYYEILKELMPTYIMHGKTKQKDDEIAAEKFKETGGLLVGTTGKLGR